MTLFLLDTNIVIYSFDAGDRVAPEFIGANRVSCSVISRIEALGTSKVTDPVARLLRRFFDEAPVFDLDEPTIEMTIVLRQRRAIKLGDAIIAATAIVNDLTLATRNVKDFAWIDELKLIDPFAVTGP